MGGATNFPIFADDEGRVVRLALRRRLRAENAGHAGCPAAVGHLAVNLLEPRRRHGRLWRTDVDAVAHRLRLRETQDLHTLGDRIVHRLQDRRTVVVDVGALPDLRQGDS